MRHVMALVVVAAARLAYAQETGPPPEAPRERAAVPEASVPRVTLSGRILGTGAFREGTIEETRGNLGSAVGTIEDDTFFSGRLTARLDVEIRRTIRGVLELENQPYQNGENKPFGEDGVEAFFEQAYVELSEFLTPKLTARLGIQDVRLTLRPHADAFFLDVSESESFYGGAVFGPTGSFVRNTADRDLSEAAGVRLVYDAQEFLLFHLFGGITHEAGSTKDDESLFYGYGNLWIPDKLSAFLLLSLVAGPEHESQVFTFGFGADWYPTRTLELFGEAYFQFGSLDASTDKQALGLQVGGRIWIDNAWLEAGFAFRSGDDDPADGEDGAFQSYESVNQFLVLESAEFGLDWDTNVRSIRLAAGLQGAVLGGAFQNVNLRLDLGLFRFNEDVRSSTGSVLVPGSDDGLGTELDVTFEWIYDPTVTFSLRGGWVGGSDVMEALTAEGDASGMVVVAGGELRF